MKSTTLAYFLLIVIATFYSCGDATIEGTWDIVYVGLDQTVETVDNGETSIETAVGRGSNYNAQMTFNSDDTYEGSGSYDYKIEYTEGATVTVDSTTINGSDGTYSFSNMSISIDENSAGEPQDYTVTKLTKTEMIWMLAGTDIDTIGTAVRTNEGEMELRFER